MRQDWLDVELEQVFTLSAEEKNLVQGRSKSYQILFLALYKACQKEKIIPNFIPLFSPNVNIFIAEQLGIDPTIEKISGRSKRRLFQELRGALNFRKLRTQEKKDSCSMKQSLHQSPIFYPTKEPTREPLLLKRSLLEFMDRDCHYKEKFLQSQYYYGFDGYSYMGQEDSLNQYSEDKLFSFVLSTETLPNKFPKEFQRYLQEEFSSDIKRVRTLELEILKRHFTEKELEFYKNHITHMISCNYYPSGASTGKLLTSHVDASLFSVFPFGTPAGLMTGDISLRTENSVFAFTGYLAEYLTRGRIKAFNHWVNAVNPSEERLSFAFFSIPKRDAQGEWGDTNLYFRDYLNLF